MIPATLDIVFASDDNYIKYTAVTLASLLKNTETKKPIRVFLLLGNSLSEDDVSNLERLKTIREYEFFQIIVDASIFNNIKTSDGISIATYYRLAMHDLLPEDSTHVLYLDSDLIIQQPIEHIFEYADESILFWGVEDSISKSYNERFGLPANAKHVNAGVMLVNLALVRSISFNTMIEQYLKINRYRVFLGDQQILAELFHSSTGYLPVKWNVHGGMFSPNWMSANVGINNNMDKREVREALTAPGIIHYTLKRKPWISLEHPKAKVWYSYLQLTPYAAVIKLADAKNSDAKNKAAKVDKTVDQAKPVAGHFKEHKMTFERFFKVLVPAYFKSFKDIRKTRLEVNQLKAVINSRKLITQPVTSGVGGELGTALDYKIVNEAMASKRPPKFNAREAIGALGKNPKVNSNVKPADIDGGYCENIKSIFQTSNFSFVAQAQSEVVVFLSQRLKQDMFWYCLKDAYLREKPVFFVEVALFGGFAGFFDHMATAKEKQALGFVVDDMGYYFDSNQPSRFERTLNSGSYSLPEVDVNRVRSIISKINIHNITKYNKYVAKTEGVSGQSDVESNSVLIIDQKKGDASIEFAGANDDSFAAMMQAAVTDNPGKKIYFKRHPDSVHKNFNSYRNRNIKEIKVLPDDISISEVLEKCSKVYTVSSQVGFEALLRGKEVVCFGVPFYSGWGLTDDRIHIPRRCKKRSIEEIFHQICIQQSVYYDSSSGKVIELEELIDLVLSMRETSALS